MFPRASDNIVDFCKSLPKVELHAHINGSLSKETLKELGCSDDSIEQYGAMEKREITLKEGFRLFKFAHEATSDTKSVYRATQSVIKDFFNENVIYLELRSTPRSEESMSKEEYVESIVKAIEDNELDILVKLILSIDRRHDIETSFESLKLILRMKDKYPDIVKGIDLSGNPYTGTFNEELFKKARDNGLFTSIHCAEIKNDEEVEKILNFGPDRIGHATFIHPSYGGSDRIWQLYCEKRIPVECCITSNVLCQTAKNHNDHHIGEWIKHSLPFSINTDDKGVFCTSLSKEYEYVLRHYNLSNLDLWRVAFNSVDQSFATFKEKDVLKSRLSKWFTNRENIH